MSETLNRNQHNMRLEVWDGNHSAIKYYETNSFVVTDKKHQKQTSDGKIFHGSEMVCTDVSSAYNNLNSYLENRSPIPTVSK